MTASASTEWITVRLAASLLGVSVQRVHQLINSKYPKLRFQKGPGGTLVNAADVELRRDTLLLGDL